MKLFKGNKKGVAPAAGLILTNIVTKPFAAIIVTAITTLIIAGYTAVKNAINPPQPAPLGFLNNPWILGGILIFVLVIILKKK